MDYFDTILGLIPVSGVTVGGLAHMLGFDISLSVPLAGLVAALFIAHALFVNPPRDPAFGPQH